LRSCHVLKTETLRGGEAGSPCSLTEQGERIFPGQFVRRSGDFYFRKDFSFCYLAIFAFSALTFAQRAFFNFEILALPAADIVRLRLTPLGRTSSELTGAKCEPFNARIAP
jgi:hypothetical protein